MFNNLTPAECRELVAEARKILAGTHDATLRSICNVAVEEFEQTARAIERREPDFDVSRERGLADG